MKTLFLPLLVAFSSIASASEWLHLFDSGKESYSIDLESVKNVSEYNKDTIKAWYKLEAYKASTKDDLKVGDETLVLYNFDCKKETMGISRAQKYRNKLPLGKGLDFRVPNMREVIPNTLGAETLDRACSIYQINNDTD